MAKKTRTKRKGSFKGKVAADAKRQKSAASNYGYLKLGRDVQIFKEEPGSRVRLDIMPYEVTDQNHPDRNDDLGIAQKGDLWYKRPFKIHRNIGASNETVVCPTGIGKKCPICEYRTKRMREGADKEETNALRPALRNLYAVVPVDSKSHEAVPHVWDISQYLFQNLLNDELEEDADYERFPELEDGLTLRIRFDSKTIGKSNPFAEASRIDFEDRKKAYGEDILEDIPNLDDMLTILSYKQLEAMFMEVEDEDIAEEDVEEAEEKDDIPKPPRRRRKKAEPEPEEDEEEEEEEEEEVPDEEEEPEEEEEEKPKPKTRTRTRDKKKGKKDEKERCPYGHRFGIDTEEFDDCDECEEWDDCIEAKEANEK